jgi:DNA-binding CsgD family transcriptional regulator
VTLVGLEERQRFIRLIHRNLGLEAFFEAADRTLARLIDFDSSCWLSLDPSTLLPTGHFTREVASDHLMELAANEFLEDDVNKFADLARTGRPVGILSQATHGHPLMSPRFANILAPHGYGEGDELRATFRDGDGVWGCVAVHRRVGTFSERDADVVAEMSSYIGGGIRRAVLATGLAVGNGHDSPGVIVLRGDDTLESMTSSARRWLNEIVDATGVNSPVPLVVTSLADKARQAFDGTTDEVAAIRVPRKSGGWLLMHAALLEGGDDLGSVVVTLHPAAQPQIASLIVEAYGLSKREREVTRLVLAGLSTEEMADNLHVSTYTVQDHLKAIFAKVGVHSRRELVAQIFLQHYAPRLDAGSGVRPNGQALWPMESNSG